MMIDQAPPLDFKPTSSGLLRHAVERFGEKDFIVDLEGRLTFVEADRLSRAFAKRLVLMGVGKGSRVAAKYPNGVSWIIVWLAVTRIGGFFMPLSSVYKTGETKKCLRIADAEFYISPELIVGRDQRVVVDELLGQPLGTIQKPLMLPELPFLRQVIFTSLSSDRDDVINLSMPLGDIDERVPDGLLDEMESEVTPADWMFSIFTSGSTSDPKCVIHTHGAAIRHATAIVELNQWISDDKVFAGMPFFWVGGNCYTVLPVMLAGATILCMERFEPGIALDFMEREGCTRVTGWPGVLNPLMEHPSLPGRSIPGFDDPVWNPKVGFMTGLGMSETGSNHTSLYAQDRALPAAIGSVGRPIPFVEHRIVDPDTKMVVAPGETGNIQVRGYSIMSGIYKREREDTFEADGFFDTKDRGFFKDGFLFFAGRDVGLIKTAGNNVSALEVESLLKTLPGVQSAYVVGLPDEAIGQIVAAAIVPSGPGAVDADAIIARLRHDLSSYKVPKILRILEAGDIPFLSNGKLDLRQLVDRIAAG
jgi:acyl-CoA synthetase (AMP-forming)/AMP-acid ligase II